MTVTFSKRCIANLETLSVGYAFINMPMGAAVSLQPLGPSYATGKTFNQCIDPTTGWPNDASVAGRAFGFGVPFPTSTNYTGTYTMTWDGDGTVNISSQAQTETFSSTGSNYSGNDTTHTYSNTSGLKPNIVITITNLPLGNQTTDGMIFQFTSSGTGSAHLHNFQFYRTGDASRLAAGKLFRTPWLQSYANLNPSAIRFMNWNGFFDGVRYENRSLPLPGIASSWTTAPLYGETTGTGTNYSLAAVSTGAKQTSATPTHGERVICRINTALPGNGGLTQVASISNASNGRVVTSTPHGYTTGDLVIHWDQGGTALLTAMPKLALQPCTITVIDATTYDLNINTTTYGTFSSCVTTPYIGLTLGAWSRFPILERQGLPAYYGQGWSAHDYLTFEFDKTINGEKDSSGNWITGAWIVSGNTGVPHEWCTQVINELNELSVSQGIPAPIHMWVTTPVVGMDNTDPDTSSGSTWAPNMVSTILNGANGFPGLTANANVFVEYGNECWNSAFISNNYVRWRSYIRYTNAANTSPPTTGDTLGDYVDIQALRSSLMMRNIMSANSNNPRIIRVLAGQGAGGMNGSGGNDLLCASSRLTYYPNDVLMTWGSDNSGDAIYQHDCFAYANYFDASYGGLYYGTATFTTDVSNYASGNPTLMAAALQSYADHVFLTADQGGEQQAVQDYSGTGGFVDQFSTGAHGMQLFGKTSVCYEGMQDFRPGDGTTAEKTFKTAMINSTQWRDTAMIFFNKFNTQAHAAMPGTYFHIGFYDGSGFTPGNQRWAYTGPDSYGYLTTGVEGQGLLDNPTWVALSLRNQQIGADESGTAGFGIGVDSFTNQYGIYRTLPRKIPHA